MIDTTLGTAILYVLLRAAQSLLACTGNNQLAKVAAFGNYKGYGTRTHSSIGAMQLILWLLLVTLMKFFKVEITEQLLAIVQPQGQMVWLWHHPKVKLFIVMLATPAVMNSMQYLIVDTFIDSAHNKSAARIASD